MSNYNLEAHPKIYQVGTKYVKDICDSEVIIQEKCDGSQFSFFRLNENVGFRSKNCIIYDENTNPNFSVIVKYLLDNQCLIPNGYVFYGEFFNKPKHNTLKYSRVPKNNLIIFAAKKIIDDVWVPNQMELRELAEKMNFETVPLLYSGLISNLSDNLKKYLEYDSILGGTKIEGVVIKNYSQAYQFGNLTLPFLCAKYVCESFKEKNGARQKKDYCKKSKLEILKEELCTEARWRKAVYYLKDSNLFTNTPKDIGALIKRVKDDVAEEEKEYIMERLYSIYSHEILSYSIHGLPQWYKDKIMEGEFDD